MYYSGAGILLVGIIDHPKTKARTLPGKRSIYCQLGDYKCYLFPFTFELEKTFDWKYPAKICDLQEMLVSSSPSFEMKNPQKMEILNQHLLGGYNFTRAGLTVPRIHLKSNNIEYWLKFTTLVDLIWIPPSCQGWQIPISWGNWELTVTWFWKPQGRNMESIQHYNFRVILKIHGDSDFPKRGCFLPSRWQKH